MDALQVAECYHGGNLWKSVLTGFQLATMLPIPPGKPLATRTIVCVSFASRLDPLGASHGNFGNSLCIPIEC